MDFAAIDRPARDMAYAVHALLAEIGSTPETANHADWMLYRHCRAGHGGDAALGFGNGTYTNGELAAAASSVADWLRGHGVGRGDHVVLLLPDCPALAAVYFGAVATGATAIVLNPALPPEDIFYIAQLVGAVVAICDRAALAAAAPLRHLPGMRALAGADRCWRASSEVIDGVALREDCAWTVAGGAQCAAYGLLTSGSTGRPKLIVHRHIDILYGFVGFARGVLGLGASDCMLCVAKMSTGYGLGSSLLMPRLAAARSALVAGSPGREVIDAIAPHRVSLLLGQPRFLAEALELAGAPEALTGVRLVLTGGEPLGAGLATRWRDLCPAPLLETYGNTEVGFLYVVNRPGEERPGSIGRPIVGIAVEVIDSSGAPTAPGEFGTLRVRGPSVITEYRGAPEASSRAFRDGWFITSDVASCDADGYIYVHGRSDHFIKLGCGDWVNPSDLERVLMQNARVFECAVIGAADESGLTILKAVVVADGEGETGAPLAAELGRAIRARWPDEPFKHLGKVEFAAALPKTTAGKLDRARLSPQSMTEFSYKC